MPLRLRLRFDVIKLEKLVRFLRFDLPPLSLSPLTHSLSTFRLIDFISTGYEGLARGLMPSKDLAAAISLREGYPSSCLMT